MRKTYFWLLCSMFVCGTLVVTSCSDDDDDNNGGSVQMSQVNYEKTGGSGAVTLSSGEKIDFQVPQCSEENMAGASIVNDELSVNLYESGEGSDGSWSYSSCNLSVDGYSANKSEYSDVYFYFSQSSGGGSQTFQSVVSETRAEGYGNKLVVTQLSDGSYKFVITGDAYAYDSNSGGQGNSNVANATVSVEFVVPLAANASTSTNVSSKQSSYPSFMPWLGKTVDGVCVINKSQYVGNAVMLWYYDTSLGYSDYEDLKNQAIKALGNPVDCYDKSEGQQPNQDWEDMCYSYFYKDGKFIMVSYCPWRVEEDPQYYQLPKGWDALMATHAARIQVHAIEGMSFDYTALLNGHR